MKIENYRIREFNGHFYIEVKDIVKITTGHLWWKKSTEEEKWFTCGSGGGRAYLGNFMPTYDTLEGAKKSLKGILKGNTYHYLKNNEVKIPDIDVSTYQERV